LKSLHLATPEDLAKLMPLVAGFHAEQGHEGEPELLQEALLPLLEGSPHGAVWLIGLRRAPVGHVMVSFGWSLELGGLSAHVQELFIRPAVRRRGMGGEALHLLGQALKQGGVRELLLAADPGDETLTRFWRRARFQPQPRSLLMRRVL